LVGWVAGGGGGEGGDRPLPYLGSIKGISRRGTLCYSATSHFFAPAWFIDCLGLKSESGAIFAL